MNSLMSSTNSFFNFFKFINESGKEINLLHAKLSLLRFVRFAISYGIACQWFIKKTKGIDY